MDLQSSLFLDQRVGIITSLDADRASNTWHQVIFDVPFSEDKKVVIIPKTQTYNGTTTPNLRIRNVTRLGFEIRIDELIGDTSLSDGSHASEVVGWIAYGFYPGSGSTTSTTSSTASATSSLPPAEKDYYLIAKHSGKTLAVSGISTADGANVLQWVKAVQDNHKWRLEAAGDGSFYLIAKHSGKALQVNGGNQQDGANVDQWTKQNVDHHKWLLEDAGNGYFYIIAKHSGKALQVNGGKHEDGANVDQWTKQNVDHHKWKFEAV
ncbi:RICIN domain-containing protein [Nostoc sp. LEGE 12447]|uniref:RICIN domain-containing protein n=1 Tax=Nostoc sp. LEGE 12447 TaxID=1828640 RepID=UPI001884460C|nr:RICIN domain-containing protein [Nostoc sp. LEGE 12447]MBE9000805.1 RICIN domain-containing protein [Nostoc sp. LEGE 12447]